MMFAAPGLALVLQSTMSTPSRPRDGGIRANWLAEQSTPVPGLQELPAAFLDRTSPLQVQRPCSTKLRHDLAAGLTLIQALAVLPVNPAADSVVDEWLRARQTANDEYEYLQRMVGADQRWPPAYDAADLTRTIATLVGSQPLRSSFYDLGRLAGGFCQGDILELNARAAYLDADGRPRGEKDHTQFWLLLANTCDLSRDLHDPGVFTGFHPVPIELRVRQQWPDSTVLLVS